MSGTATRGRRPDRGQTLLDFVVAVGLFVLAIAFVASFVPQMTVPYESQEKPLVAERTTDTLADTLLAGPAPSTLDEECTVAFFEQGNATGCPFDSTESVTDQVGIGSQYDVNVTVRRRAAGGGALEPLCSDDGTVGPCGTSPLAIGPPVPEDRTIVASASRTVSVNGTDAVLEVRVW